MVIRFQLECVALSVSHNTWENIIQNKWHLGESEHLFYKLMVENNTSHQ
jgi:hypothetical protein